ncbi:glycosyltransferase family 2 protein [Agromyces sp. NPDC058136]|uniref:glycosyltransferase family 2 protein n=1 Tax=Agromyces sp. NPDC058136 TaxID=3346354 RepID=UPI0036DEA834
MRFHRPVPATRTERVTVVVPCYRYGNYLPTAVDSVLQQEGVEVEVIIIDDASGDGSAEVARAIAARDERVRVIEHTVNAGHIASYNEGLRQATGDYVVLLSADDALVDGSLERAVGLMQRFPTVGMVYGHSEWFVDDLPQIDGRARSWTTWSGRRWLASMCRRSVNPVYTPGVVMRRQAWDEIGHYDARVPHAADMLLWYQTAALWDIGRVNNRAQALYRRHGANMHLTQFSGMLTDMREQREVIRIVFDEPPGGVRLPEHLLVSGYRALARRATRLARAELRETADPAAASAYLEFAAATVEGVPRAEPGRTSRQVDRWLESPHAGFARRVERHLEWRVWRRYGT